MDVRLVEDYQGFLALEDSWNELWKGHCADNVFLHFRWARAFVESFALREKLYVLAAYDGVSLRAILPLVNDEGSLRFIGSPRSDYADLICSSEEAPAALESIFGALGARGDWRRLKILDIPERSPIRRCFRDNPRITKRVFWQPSSKCPGIDFSDGGETLKRLVGKKSLRRRENGLARRGAVEFRTLVDWTEIEPLLPVFFRQHVARWESAGYESQYTKHQERIFCERYIREFLEEGLLHFSVLFVEEEPLAIHIGFSTDNVFIWYKPTFDIRLSHLSPGEVLIKRLLEYCGDSGIKYFDFTRGVEPFKKRFNNRLNRNYNLTMYAKRTDHLMHNLAIQSDALARLGQRYMAASRTKLQGALADITTAIVG
jgi:CelD/BcsL family acetyltransferase involved in cellulose biosynthesis